jgi:acetyltransferase-like isoleucine patch superfamily enzyme
MVNNARIVCDDADVLVGEDGLWSDEILIQSNDLHGIVDSATGEILNAGRRRIEIGAHVLLGRRTTVMPNVTIGAGSILAAGAVLTKDVPRNCIFAGIPARSIKTGVTWSRSPYGMNDQKKYLE